MLTLLISRTYSSRYQIESFECKIKELTYLAKHGYGVVVDCKGELELKEVLIHQQPVMVFIHDEEAQQLNSAMKQRCCAAAFYLF